MTYDLLKKILEEVGVEYTYQEFTEPPKGDNYITYYETGKDTFNADNKVYAYESRFNIELYTKKKNIKLEEKLIKLLGDHNIAWSGGETTKLDTENMYMTVFYC